MLLNVFILVLTCSITARSRASRLLNAFSRFVSLWFLPDFIGIRLLGRSFSIPGYPRPASIWIDLWTGFPIVSLYTLKSCPLHLACCTSMIFFVFCSMITRVFTVWRFFLPEYRSFWFFWACLWDFPSHQPLGLHSAGWVSRCGNCVADAPSRASLRHILPGLVFAAQSPYPGRQNAVNSRNVMRNKIEKYKRWRASMPTTTGKNFKMILTRKLRRCILFR
jgi:hypothetical protein